MACHAQQVVGAQMIDFCDNFVLLKCAHVNCLGVTFGLLLGGKGGAIVIKVECQNS